MSASGNRLLEPLALHTGRLLQALQRLVLAIASGREPLVSPRVDGWALVAERASTALVELTAASLEQTESELSASLSHGYTQLLFRLAMEPCHHADIIRARGYEALCAQASRSLLAVAAAAATTATYQEEREAAAAATNTAAPRVGDDSGETVGGAAAVEDGELELESGLVSRLVECFAKALAGSVLEVAVEGLWVPVVDIANAIMGLAGNSSGRHALAECALTFKALAAGMAWPRLGAFDPDKPPPMEAADVQGACINAITQIIVDVVYMPKVVAEPTLLDELRHLSQNAQTLEAREAASVCQYGLVAFLAGQQQQEDANEQRQDANDLAQKQSAATIARLQVGAGNGAAERDEEIERLEELHRGGLILLQAAEARAEAAEAAALERQGAVEAALGLGRIVALYYRSSASYQIC